VDGDRVVNPGLDAFGVQTLLPERAVGGARRVYVIDVACVVAHERRDHVRACEQRLVALGRLAARLGPFLEILQFHPQDRALHAFKAHIIAL